MSGSLCPSCLRPTYLQDCPNMACNLEACAPGVMDRQCLSSRDLQFAPPWMWALLAEKRSLLILIGARSVQCTVLVSVHLYRPELQIELLGVARRSPFVLRSPFGFLSSVMFLLGLLPRWKVAFPAAVWSRSLSTALLPLALTPCYVRLQQAVNLQTRFDQSGTAPCRKVAHPAVCRGLLFLGLSLSLVPLECLHPILFCILSTVS